MGTKKKAAEQDNDWVTSHREDAELVFEVEPAKDHSVINESITSWGAGVNLGANEIKMPRLLLVQKMSKLVDEIGAKEGEWRDSITKELVAELELDCLIFSQTNNYLVYQKEGNKKKFVRSEELTPENSGNFGEINGEYFYHSFHYSLLVLVEAQPIEAQIPYIVTLNSFSRRAALNLNTYFARLNNLKKPSASKVISLKAKREQNDEGSWYSIDWSVKRDSTDRELAAAKGWWEGVARGQVKESGMTEG